MSQRINLGRVMPINKRAYSSSVSYAVMDIVEYEGSSYWCIQACQGVLPTNNTNWQIMSQKGADGSNGTNGVDGEDAYQPFKGWYDSSSSLSSSISSPVVGDYAYVMGASASDPVTVYMCSTAGTWTASQNEFNPANNQSFQTGQDLDQTKIINDLTTGGANHVLSAEAGKTLNTALGQLGPEINKLKPKNIVEDGLWICGSDGKALLRLDQLDSMGQLGQNLANTIKTLINDKLGTGVTKIEASQLGTELTAQIEAIAESKAGRMEPRDTVEDGIWLCDTSGKALLRLDTLDTKGGVGENLANSIKTLIQSTSATGFTTLEAQALGTNITALIEAIAGGGGGGGGSTNIIDTVEDGFYIANEEGEAIAKYIDGTWHFGQVDGIAKSVSALAGTDGCRVKQDFAANEKVRISNYPIHEKKGTTICFGGKISSSFGTVRVGKNEDSSGDLGAYAEVTATKLRIVYYISATKSQVAEIDHELTISTFVNLLMTFKNDGTVKATMQTLGGWATIEPTTYDVIVSGEKTGTTTINFTNVYGPVTAQTIGTAMTGCEISVHNPDFKCPVWMFGDSYFSVNGSRWIGSLKELGYFNFYLNALGGRASSGALEDLRRALNWGCPKYLVFALITNDSLSSDAFAYSVNQVIALCKERGITLVLTTQGGLPNKDYSRHCQYILSTGERYIDFAHAVATNGWESGSTWYDGLLSSDGAHPTQNGAKTLAMQALKDMPEILQLCKGGLD